MKTLLLKTITLLSFLFAVNTCFAEDLSLLRPTGTYAIGTKAIELKDDFRQMLRGKEQRRWMVQAFYPSEMHAGAYPYMPGTLEDGVIEGVSVSAYAKQEAVLLKAKHPYPLILFVPGLGAERQAYTMLCEDLASHGYVVLSLDQPYVSNFVRFSDGTTLMPTFKDLWKVSRDREYRYSYYDEAMGAALGDLTYMLDHLQDINNAHFDGRLHTKDVVLIGHSFGGNVAHTLGFKDTRIKAVIDIDSKITERKIYGHVGVPPNVQGKPVLFIRSQQYQEDVGEQLTKVEHANIWHAEVQHGAFSDRAYLASHIPTIKRNGFFSALKHWLFASGPSFSATDAELNGQEVAGWFSTYRAHVRGWLKTIGG